MKYVPDDIDRAILRLMQDNLPVTQHPYAGLAEETGCTEEEIVTRILRLKEAGVIRRVGAILRHGRAGYACNALTAWTVTPEGTETREEARDRVGEALAQNSHISHCYARHIVPEFPYPMFAMVHAASEEELQATLTELKAMLPTEEVRILPSVREWKKTSMRYFETE